MTTGYLARTRIGTAAVDMSIPDSVTAGESVSATVELWGGTTDERAEGLAAVFGYGSSARRGPERVSARIQLADPFTIPAADHRILGTQIDIPHRVPATLGDTRVRFGIEEPGPPLAPDLDTSEPTDSTDIPNDPMEKRPDSTEDRTASIRETTGSTQGPTDPTRKTTDSTQRTTARPHRASTAERTPTPYRVATDGGETGSRWASLTMAGTGSRSIEMRPGDRLAQVLDAVSALGFFLVAAEPITDHDDVPGEGRTIAGRKPGSVPLQEIRFRPRWGPYATAGDLFLYPAPSASRLDVGIVLSEDQPPRGRDRRPVADRDRLTVRMTDRRAVRTDLRQLLDRQAVEA